MIVFFSSELSRLLRHSVTAVNPHGSIVFQGFETEAFKRGWRGGEATSSNLPPLLNDYRISVVENPVEFKTETKRAGIQMEEYFELGRYHQLKRFTCRLRIALCIAFL